MWYARDMRTATLSITLAGLGLLAACRGDAVKCDSACRNYSTLTFWQAADAKIATLPPEKQEYERSLMTARFVSEQEQGIDMCVSQCRSANNEDQMDCMIAAKTADAVKACVED
jgi:hypothetical protein